MRWCRKGSVSAPERRRLGGVGEECAEQGNQYYERAIPHGRDDKALSSGALSRNSSGRPINSFGMARRFARSLSDVFYSLVGHVGRGLKQPDVCIHRFFYDHRLSFP